MTVILGDKKLVTKARLKLKLTYMINFKQLTLSLTLSIGFSNGIMS